MINEIFKCLNMIFAVFYINSITFTSHVLWYLYRFDMLTGFNGMEGNFYTGSMLGGHLMMKNMSLEDGCRAEEMQEFLAFFCSMMVSPNSQELCAYFVSKEYGIEDSLDDFDRTMGFTQFASKITLTL